MNDEAPKMGGAVRGLPRTRVVGLSLAVVTACISGVAIFVNTYFVVQSPDATVYTTAKNAIAAALLLLVLMATSRGSKISPKSALTPRQWVWLAALGLIGGSIAFVLFFEGLARAESAQTAGFIHKTLVVWVALLAVPLLREKLTGFHIAAIALLLMGQVVLADLGTAAFGTGELMIFGATLLWAVEFVVAKRLLAAIPSPAVAAARLGIGTLFLLMFVVATGRAEALMSLTAQQWTWAFVTGAILAAFVATWFAALARAQAVDVTAVLVLGQIITTLLAAGIKGAPIATNVAVGLLLIALGVTAAAAGTIRSRRVPAVV